MDSDKEKSNNNFIPNEESKEKFNFNQKTTEEITNNGIEIQKESLSDEIKIIKKDTLKDNYDYPNFLSQNESKVRFSSSNQIANDIEKLSFFESFSSKKSQIIIK